MEFLWAFLVGGAICAVGQLLLDFTKLTPARILVLFVTAGVVLTALGWYGPLVELAGFIVELIASDPGGEGVIPHIAIYVDDVDQAAADLKALGVDTFLTPEKVVMPDTFGGLENWFFTGPSGEQLELLKML